MSGLLMLAMRVEDLDQLADWMPVAVLAETIFDAARGHGGVSEHEARRVNGWASRWVRLPIQVRSFYARHASSDPIVGGCLYRLLEGGPEPAGPAIGHLYALWRDDVGAAPPSPLWFRFRRSG